MAYWVEVHCDVLSDGPPDWSHAHSTSFCLTNNNENPAAGGQSAQKAARHAEAEAKRQRWTKRGTQWVCPRCRRELAAKALETSSSAGVAAYRARTG